MTSRIALLSLLSRIALLSLLLAPREASAGLFSIAQNRSALSLGLSTLDGAARVLYTLLANESDHNTPALYGVSLATGAVVSTTAVPGIVNGDAIGAGQALGLVRESGDVVVAGSDAAGSTAFFLATPATGAVRLVGTLNATLYGLAASCSHIAHVPASNTLFFGGYANDASYTRLVLSMDVATGAVRHSANPEGHEITGFSYDAATGNVVGLGSHGSSEETIIAQLNVANRTVSSLGAVPQYPYSAAGLEALDAAGGTLSWVGGPDYNTPFYLIVNRLSAGVPVASTAEVCASFDSCSLLTLDFDAATARALAGSLALLVPVLAAALAAGGFRGRELVLGIDLGTTFSAVAVSENGAPARALRLAGGRDSLPSAVALTPDGALVAGDAARAAGRAAPRRLVVDAKRVIGRAPGDAMVASERRRHGGRLVAHPTAGRTRTQGRLAALDGAACAPGGAAGGCEPEVAFALPLPPALPAAARAALARDACVAGDPGPAVLPAHAPALAGVLAGGGPAGRPADAADGADHGAAGGAAAGGLRGPPADAPATHYLLLTPTAAGCVLARSLLASARCALREPTRALKAAVAVPAEFRHAQRAATLDAFQRAGVPVTRTLLEPTAAALAFGLAARPDVHNVLVFDMGGGTLDVSVLYHAAGAFTVIGAAGDNALGGEDVDDCVAGLLADDVEARGGVVVDDGGGALGAGRRGAGGGGNVEGGAGGGAAGSAAASGASGAAAAAARDAAARAAAVGAEAPAAGGGPPPAPARRAGAAPTCALSDLRGLAEALKVRLSGDGGAGGEAAVAWRAPGGGGACGGGVLARDAFERGCGALFDRVLAPVRAALDAAALGPAEVEEVVLVGGSSRLPAVRQRLADFFPGRPIRGSVDPDLAVALGAAAAGE